MYRNNIHPRSISGILEDIFQQGLNKTSEVITTLGHAPVNIFETDAAYELSLIAPGLSKEAFKISIDKNVLSIAFEQKEEEATPTGKFLRKEFKTRSFKRSFNIDELIDTTSISAKYTDGILALNLPKKANSEQPAKEIIVG
jgi:HSP20 family protein